MESKSENVSIKAISSLLASGDFDRALEIAKLAKDKLAADSGISVLFGDIYSGKGEIEKALHYYELGIQLGTTSTLLYLNAALCADLSGRFSKAIEYLSKGLELEPENDQVLSEKANVIRKLDKRQDDVFDEIGLDAKNHLMRCEIHDAVFFAVTSMMAFETMDDSYNYALKVTSLIRSRYFPNTRIYVQHNALEETGMTVALACHECSKLEDIWMYAKAREYEKFRSIVNEIENFNFLVQLDLT
jgi:tetratricopeptide (TPR) repeat protein